MIAALRTTLVSLVLFALPPLITNAYVGITEVDPDIVEASRGMGMGERKVFSSVELPLAIRREGDVNLVEQDPAHRLRSLVG